MWMIRLAVFIAAIAVGVPLSMADQYSCETVDAGAVAFVRQGLPVSVVETNRTCEIAVDGTVASGRSQNFTGAINGLNDTLFFSEGADYELPADMLRDMIAGPFGDANNGEGGDWAPVVQDTLDGDTIFGLSQCIRDFTDIINENDRNNAGIPLTQMGQMTDGAVKCEVVPPANENSDSGLRISSDSELRQPIIGNGALKLSVTTGAVMLSLFLPADFLRDARDGNGTFQ
jgi:hypothetical protein